MVIPHITLAGPFSTQDEKKKLVEDFTRMCTNQKVIPKYEVGTYGFFDETKVFYVTITPDENLKQFRYQLSQALSPYCSLRNYDRDSADEFKFHATLAMKLDWLTFQRIKWYFRGQESVMYRHHPIQATLLRNSKILCEYDFIQNRMLSRAQALSKATMMRDFDILKSWSDGSWE
ncbi:MAG: 2'-5' RNA ligase family protein [Methanoregula sp.]